MVLLLSAVTQLASADSHEIRAEFTDDGELIRPAGWREWVFGKLQGFEIAHKDSNRKSGLKKWIADVDLPEFRPWKRSQ